ncbi:DUF1549 and DUF1553 domain-containing protein [Brevifollis gellanilyticus]|uniref:DUF1553 domain-containing protein n=1 Tax=Brevifollis gellanilyticus TaxID=748831 RepID=A0A512M7N9_9BACT|nr:DUF1549 and DUF1553 domain-containing protein [Brevifollis gellanilyticus]GEP42361.1 hypothetical protein BGE01nite_16520 [Brevifollis gellanilyticus]
MLRSMIHLGALWASASLFAAEHWAFQPLKKVQGSSIDEFIQRRLAEQGLKPSPRADARTLVRRATMDLTGLPPSEGMTELSDQAYARLVDELLASPHYGEQWSRHWLDVARYSDTKGYVYAREEKRWVHASPYRDWVVEALNDDMPYDRFLRLQIAADQMVPAGSPDLAAMGFLTLGRRFLGVTHDIIDDRIDVVTRGTLGLTVACARCHDHKFDPIPTRDYYALYGVFQSCAEAVVPCGKGESSQKLAELQKKNRDLMTKSREERMAMTRSQVKEHLEAQLHLEQYPEEVFSQILDADDLNPVIVRRWQAWLAEDAKRAEPVFSEWHALRERGSVEELKACAERYDKLFTEIEQQWQALLKTEPKARSLPDAPKERLRFVLYGTDSPCHVPDEHISNNEMYFPTGTIVALWKAQGDVDRHVINSAGGTPHATILADRAKPSTPRIFTRGNPLTKGDAVPRQFLSLFGDQKPFAQGSGRLELAQAIADPLNPLTARVMVNRLWQHHFGRGLVSTPSDFGKQGTPPSHPALLDWLAQRFVDSGWSLKAMHRLIMLSQTYQQRSDGGVVDGGAAQVDPDNVLLWRMNTHRLSFEEARDAWLAAAGQLDLSMGGNPQPLFSANNKRRTLYTLVDRESLPAAMSTFDFANPDLSIPKRTETTVPQQALFGMNHPFIVQQVRALLIRPEMKSADPSARIRRIYEILFQRSPSVDELGSALSFVGERQPPVLAEADHSRSWQYGYGEWDEAEGRVKEFKRLPHFTGSAWQGEEAWPNKELGWAQITAAGGHPGNDRKHAVVRRWIAPADGVYAVKSTLLHEPASGDGIRSFISHSEQGRLHAGKLHQGTADLNFATLAFQKGETLDFIVDIGDVLNSDQFLWSMRIQQAATIGAGGDASAEVWDAEKDFSAQPKSQLDVWEQFVQVLMVANEFMFVD